MKIAVVNLKGGTAKSTSAMFLAAALSRRGRTLVVDCDPQGSALTWAEAAEEDGGEMGFNVVSIPTRDVKKRVDRLAGDYEYVVLDTPPTDLTRRRRTWTSCGRRCTRPTLRSWR